MPIQPIAVQRRMMELGRIRLGEKGTNGAPKKLNVFRFTSASKALLDALAEKYGGTVKAWEGAPDEGYFELTTKASAVDIVLPPVFSDQDGQPTYPFSQWFELWSGGGCQRRCDGVNEALSGKPCLCNPEDRTCKPTTRVSFMMPDVPGLGVWRVESHGYNVAAEMPGTIAILANAASEGKFIPAVLRLEPRTSKKAGQTRKFVVPVIDLPDVTVNQIAAGDVPLAINAPPAPPAERPALPAPKENGALPADATFEQEEGADFGTPPPLPAPEPAPKKPSKAERDKLVKITAQLGEMDPSIDWPAMVEKAANETYSHGVDELTKDEIAQLLGRLVKHAETMNPEAVPA